MMAIKLLDTDVTFFEMVKTGSTFIKVSLENCGIPFRWYDPLSYIPEDIMSEPEKQINTKKHRIGYFRHSPWWAYRYTSHKVCIIRHPISWYESFWRFFHNATRYIIRIGFFQDIIELDIPFEKDFNVFIDRIINEKPAFYSRMAEQFFGPDYSMMDTVFKTESLNLDLYRFLTNLEYPENMIQPILNIGPVNKSNKKITINWNEKQKEKILYLEQEIIKRFYNE